jgi:hypothetical protein
MIDEPFDYAPDTAATAWAHVATVTGLVAAGALIAAVVVA